jgi:hypothetical protein
MKRSRWSITPSRATEDADLPGFYGSDGTRARDPRRDRPVLALPGLSGNGRGFPTSAGLLAVGLAGIAGCGRGRPAAFCGISAGCTLPQLRTGATKATPDLLVPREWARQRLSESTLVQPTGVSCCRRRSGTRSSTRRSRGLFVMSRAGNSTLPVLAFVLVLFAGCGGTRSLTFRGNTK